MKSESAPWLKTLMPKLAGRAGAICSRQVSKACILIRHKNIRMKLVSLKP